MNKIYAQGRAAFYWSSIQRVTGGPECKPKCRDNNFLYFQSVQSRYGVIKHPRDTSTNKSVCSVLLFTPNNPFIQHLPNQNHHETSWNPKHRASGAPHDLWKVYSLEAQLTEKWHSINCWKMLQKFGEHQCYSFKKQLPNKSRSLS